MFRTEVIDNLKPMAVSYSSKVNFRISFASVAPASENMREYRSIVLLFFNSTGPFAVDSCIYRLGIRFLIRFLSVHINCFVIQIYILCII